MEIENTLPWECEDRLFRPETRLVRFERIAFDGVRSNHDSIVEASIKKLAPGSRPGRLETSGRRDLPFAYPNQRLVYEAAYAVASDINQSAVSGDAEIRCAAGGTAPQLVVVLNWLEELKRLTRK